MKNKKSLFNYNSIFNNLLIFHISYWVQGSCLFSALLFSVCLVRNPYLSLLMTFCWNSFKLLSKNLKSILFVTILSFLNIYIFLLVDDFVIYNLFAIKVVLVLLIISVFISIYNPKMVYLRKVSLVLLEFYIFLLGLLLYVVKIYFFNAVSFFAVEKVGYPISLDHTPSDVYLTLKNYDFMNIRENSLFVIDFSNDGQFN